MGSAPPRPPRSCAPSRLPLCSKVSARDGGARAVASGARIGHDGQSMARSCAAVSRRSGTNRNAERGPHLATRHRAKGTAIMNKTDMQWKKDVEDELVR